jgi:hypothetical protein
MADYEKNLRQYNEVVTAANSPMLQPAEPEKTEIGGKAGLQITTKVPQPPGVPPQSLRMMEAMFGPGGKVVGWLAPADEHTVVLGYGKEAVTQTIKAIQEGKPGLGREADVAKTAALLPTGAPLVKYVSVQGTIDFINRLLPAVLPPQVPQGFTLPKFPAAPPIGFAAVTAPEELRTVTAVPAEVIRAIGQYVAEIQGAKGR